MKIRAATVGKGRRIAPLIEIQGEIVGDKLAQFLESEGGVPGTAIVGQSRGRSFIDAPLHLGNWHTELRDVSFIGGGDDPCGEQAQLTLENPGAPTLTRVHFEPPVGVWGLHVAVTEAGRPDGTIIWQSRGYERPCARHSMGAYVDCTNHGQGGGMLFENQVSQAVEQGWRNEGDKGVWFNHAHVSRGHIACTARKHDIRRAFLGIGSPYVPLPSIEVRNASIDVTDMHVDAYPSLGVVVKDEHREGERVRVRWHGPGGYVEPRIKSRYDGMWYTSRPEEQLSVEGWELPYFDGNPPPVWMREAVPNALIETYDYPHDNRWHFSG
ncbi:MAG: hypothetical protein AAFN78_00965 [Pseudomonadota bacterium]